MKVLLLALMLTLSACTSHNQYGKCIGIADEGNPNLIYKTDVYNTVISFILIETIIVPIFWALDYAKCPIGHKPTTQPEQPK